MTPRFSDDLHEIDDANIKTAVIDMELTRLQMDIVALQETRLPDSGSVRERNFTFLAAGIHLLQMQGNFVAKTPSISGSGHSNHTPNLSSPEKAKDKLATTIKGIPAEELLFILGDFNASVGADQSSWSVCLDQFCIGKMNENGQRLLEFCCHYSLCISNTFFSTKPPTQSLLETPKI